MCTFGVRSKDAGAYDLGELDQALFLYLDGQDPSTVNQDQRQSGAGMRPPTLNIFPSQPMHVEPSKADTTNATGLVSSATGGSKKSSEPSMELANTRNVSAPGREPAKAIKREGKRKGPTTSSSEQEGPKTPDPKTLRRLAQNREAARKSRLRKKAYVQQLESSRIKLTQLEQELQRARAQGVFLCGGGEQGLPVGIANINSDAAFFDMEYARWLEEHHRLMCELRAALQEHIPENELRLFVDNCLAHYDEMMNLKIMVAKTDVFHLVSGMWKTPAERCFMWMGGFRPSELIKIIVGQIEPLTEQQILGICGLQQSTQENEDALSQGLEALNQSLSDTIASESLSYPPNMANYMGQMAVAMNKLSTLEGFVRQLVHLTSLRLDWLNLTGTVPDFLSQLKNLTFLDLSFNGFSGSIPSSLALLPNLGALHLDRNKLTGSIPESFGTFKGSVPDLYLSHNQLTGEIPASLGNMDFSVIDLSRNKLVGDASMLFGLNKTTNNVYLSRNLFEFNLSNVVFPSTMENLDISHNKIFGSIPPQMTQLPLQSLDDFSGNLSGEIPAEIGDLPYLKTLEFHKLTNITGPVPTSISKLIHLISLTLSRLNLTGPVPDSLSNLKNLRVLNLSFNSLSGNKLTGPIPESFGNFVGRVSGISLSPNQLSGKIPASLDNRNFRLVDFSRNKLEGDASMFFGLSKTTQ
ncbi:hypothetical protein D5086_012265, partial [Populus alba]